MTASISGHLTATRCAGSAWRCMSAAACCGWCRCSSWARFSGLVAIQPGHKLVTSGLYGVIRHPSYLGLLVNSVGWALAFRSVVGLLLTALLVPPLLARIQAEERLLQSQFGDEYDVYRRSTSRLI